MKDYEKMIRDDGWSIIRVDYLFKDCPKSDGWFGCYFSFHGLSVHGQRTDNKLMGRVPMGRQDVVLAMQQRRLVFVKLSSPSVSDGNAEFVLEDIDVVPSVVGVMSKLKSLPGIGAVSAKKCVDEFGMYTCMVADRYPDLLGRLDLPEKKLSVIRKALSKRSSFDILRSMLPRNVFSDNMLGKVCNFYESQEDEPVDPVDVMLHRPYDMLDDFSGDHRFTFKLVDKAALCLGVFDEHDPIRVRYCLADCVKSYIGSQGHSCIDLDGDVGCVSRLYVLFRGNYFSQCNISEDEMFAMLHESLYYKVISRASDDGTMHRWLYPSDLYRAETGVSSIILGMLGRGVPGCLLDEDDIRGRIGDYESRMGMSLDDGQAAAVVRSLGRDISVITGIPGAGKTATAACIVDVWSSLFPGSGIYLMAPTGLATRRIYEAVSDVCDVPVDYGTIDHYIVSCCGSLGHDKKQSLVIVDECSMLDLVKAYMMFGLIRNEHVILLGDADQLPSIGAGQFFKDVVKSGAVPVSYLSICHRSSDVAALAGGFSLVRGGVCSIDPAWRGVFGNVFQFWRTPDAVRSFHIIVGAYRNLVARGVPLREIAVLCPSHQPGRFDGSTTINMFLQDAINPVSVPDPDSSGAVRFHTRVGTEIQGVYCYRPSQYVPDGRRLRVGDRVLFRDNMRKYGLVNGDTGVITQWVEDTKVQNSSYVCFEKDSGECVNVDFEDFESFTLAYALTVHKSQGCEYQYVIVSMQHGCMHWGDGSFASRNLLYTAITRAKVGVCCVGDLGSFDWCIRNPIRDRNGFLAQRLLGWSDDVDAADVPGDGLSDDVVFA